MTIRTFIQKARKLFCKHKWRKSVSFPGWRRCDRCNFRKRDGAY